MKPKQFICAVEDYEEGERYSYDWHDQTKKTGDFDRVSALMMKIKGLSKKKGG